MTTAFAQLGLISQLDQTVSDLGYITPTPIQSEIIPLMLDCNDVIGQAQTGTGKTAAFALPIINRLARNRKKARPARVRALILTPTRELASQIEANIKSYGEGVMLKNLVVFGGVGYRSQIQSMSKGVDILIATPGRLLDLMNEIFLDLCGK